MGTLVSVPLEELVLGRELTFPIHATDGVKLIGAGSVLTAELKRRLIARGIQQVVLDEADVDSLTISHVEDEGSAFQAVEQQIEERLKTFLGGGGAAIRNDGPPLRDEVVQHGAKNHDARNQVRMTVENDRNAQLVDDLVERAARGGTIETRDMEDMADAAARNLLADVDATLSACLRNDNIPSIGSHSVRMSTLSMGIGIELALDAENVRVIGLAALLADLGMSAVPREIREAARPLTPAEYHEVQKHPSRTANLLESIEGLPGMTQIIAYQVHERLDGSGYPRGRERAAIHPFARVLHVADAYVAMTSNRPFRAPLMPYVAMESLLQQTRRGSIDETIMRALLQLLSLFPIGSYVTLSDGSVAKVIRSNGASYTQPIAARVTGPRGERVDSSSDDAVVDLTACDIEVVQALPRPGAKELAVDVRQPGELLQSR